MIATTNICKNDSNECIVCCDKCIVSTMEHDDQFGYYDGGYNNDYRNQCIGNNNYNMILMHDINFVL